MVNEFGFKTILVKGTGTGFTKITFSTVNPLCVAFTEKLPETADENTFPSIAMLLTVKVELEVTSVPAAFFYSKSKFFIDKPRIMTSS